MAISIGPVQDFIAAARRTNDLYAGSALLQKIVQAVTGAITNAGGTLAFPADPGNGGANKILAYLPNGEPKEVCQTAKEAAKMVLIDKWQTLVSAYPTLLNKELGDQQVAHFLEFFAAWQPWDGRDATYKEARQEVERLLAGRKALRDFVQPNKHLVPKSPLDPTRDTVLQGRPQDSLTQGPLWLKPNEYLDAVSLIKRHANQSFESVPSTEDIPSTVDIAANSFLAEDDDFKGWIYGQKMANDQKMPRGVVHRSRRDELFEEGKLSQNQHDQIVRRLGRREPTPYFAILVADGDRMGAKIAELATLSEHQQFSTRVGGFASGAKQTVERHEGHLVYAGGDDVLAFLPLHTCLACAATLAEGFNEQTGMNMTVGLAIVHYHEPLYQTLDIARQVERTAKAGGRNRLRVEWHTRGGQSRAAEHSWADGFDLEAWKDWQKAFDDGLTRGLAYELATLGREAERAALPSETVKAEANRIFARKEWDGKPEDPTSYAPWKAAIDQVASGGDLLKLSDLLILMQGLASRTTDQEVNA